MIGLVCRRKFFILLVIAFGLFIYTIFSKDYLNIPNYHARGQTNRDDSQETGEENESPKTNLHTHQDEVHLPRQEASTPALANEPGPTAFSPDKSEPLTGEKSKKNDDSLAKDGRQNGFNIAMPKPTFKLFDSSWQGDEARAQQNSFLYSTTNNVSSIMNKIYMFKSINEEQERKRVHDETFSNSELPLQDNHKYNLHDHPLLQESELRAQSNKGLLQRLLNDVPNSHLLPFSICPFLGIRETKTKTSDSFDDVTCRPKKPSEAACKEAYLAYAVELSPLTCEKQGIANDICSFKENGTIQCDISGCVDNYVYLSSVDPDYGVVTNYNTAFSVSTDMELERLVLDYKKSTTENGFNFCFIKCMSRRRITKSPYSEQLLLFPPIIANGPILDPPLININILTLDSVSRPHFYRSLPKTVEMLRRIVHDPNLEATVLDFELFQSMADYTFHNIRAFMSGKTDFDYKAHQEQHYEIEYFFEVMKSKGYYTLLQEDSCWYDEWGSLFTDNLFQGNRPQTPDDFRSRWSAFKKRLQHFYIDDFGLSHFSCEALQRYNKTNQFNHPKKICFGGKVFAEYFLDYAEKLFNQKGMSKKPIFAYTHLNTGHEISGTRIKQMDQRLSQFLLNMASLENTLTIVFSDHGPKTTPYAFHTFDGRTEIYDSLLFVLLPEKTASFLGKQRTKALIVNQKRLLTALELHNALASIANHDRENSGSTLLEGFFAEIPSNRSCSDISMKSAAVCKCDGWEKMYSTKHPSFTWLAELALGTLNNRIQNEFMQKNDRDGGFGNCQRLIGKTFEKIRRRSIGDNFLVTMDLIVLPESEIFEVQIEYPKKPNQFKNNVTVTHLSRISIYRRFEKCKDESVDLTVCVCKSRIYSSRSNRQWIIMNTRRNLLRILARGKNFDAEVKFTNLHANCLVMVTRSHSSRTSVFEIANACSDRSYKIKVSGKSKGKTIVSSQLPLYLTVDPFTAHFLFSVYHLERPYGYKTTTSYKAFFVE